RIQFTPDLMPADITGTNIVTEEGGQRRFVFQKGPIFGNIVLADEVNRATPKTQSALLEAMQEHRVTVAGTSYELTAPFFVLATQNPIEMEGTYPLPEAQLDRFMFKLDVKSSSVNELAKIFSQTTGAKVHAADRVTDGAGIVKMRTLASEVPVPSHLLDYTAKLVLATHPTSEMAPAAVRQYVRFGSSPRGGQSILRAAKVRALVEGRYNVSADDIRRMAYPALRHRVLLNFEGEAEGVNPDRVVSAVIEAVPEVPAAVRNL
ncbi:MAG: AAA family ATPase, partial [Planctomycetes bacterium]|nr:AAA family ATPase [Planctomycetota bacterium]